MSEEITPKIEPTLTSVPDAPSIVAEPVAAPAEAEKIDIKPEAKADEAPKIEPKIEPTIKPTIEHKADPAVSSAKEPAMPRATQIAPEPLAAKAAPIWLNAVRDAKAGKDEKPAPVAAAAPARSASRFPLLAATVAVAASLGAIAGSFGGAVFGRAPIATHVATTHGANNAEEIRALKETVAQLRAHTKTLTDNVAALKLGISNTSAQLTKMNEAMERRAAAAIPAAETTGSIAKPAPVVLGAPPTTLQHPVVAGWTLRRVYDGAALIEGREGVIEVEPGITIAGLGRIDDIKKQDGRWVVFTSKGIIVPPGSK